jgi:hypothetical protein
VNGFRTVERVVRNAALGLRFWDVAAAAPVERGLLVEVVPRGRPRSRTVAQPNRSGTYVAHRLAGMQEVEFSDAEPDQLWSTALRPYRIEVRDPTGRFLPVAFAADLPARGLFAWHAPLLSPPQPIALPGAPGSPPQLLLNHVPLFSAPSRAAPDPLAVVRAQMFDQGTGRPAAWGLLAVSIDGVRVGVGLADREGRVAVIFPYPEPPRMSLASPPEFRNDFDWEVEMTAFVPPQVSPPVEPAEVPDLAEVLRALDTPRGAMLASVPPYPQLRLAYRQELTVRTAGMSGADASYLWVSA